MDVFAYDHERYPFREWVSRLLGVRELERLHENGPVAGTPFDLQRNAHKLFVAGRDAELDGLLLAFLREEVAPRLPFVPALKVKPHLRVLPHGAAALTDLHRDRDNAPERGALKIWLPITRVFGSNSLWVESEEGRNDLRPIEASYGEAVLFDSLNLLHGSVQNDSGSTRLSIDFRVRAVSRRSAARCRQS